MPVTAFTFGEEIENANHGGKERDTGEDHKRVHHGVLLLPSSRLQPTGPTQSAMPTAATDHEKGASLRNWPNTNAPSATFATSGSYQ